MSGVPKTLSAVVMGGAVEHRWNTDGATQRAAAVAVGLEMPQIQAQRHAVDPAALAGAGQSDFRHQLLVPQSMYGLGENMELATMDWKAGKTTTPNCCTRRCAMCWCASAPRWLRDRLRQAAAAMGGVPSNR